MFETHLDDHRSCRYCFREARRGSVRRDGVREAVRSSCRYDVMGGKARAM